MPPKPRDRESEAVEAEEAKANKRSRNLFDHALDARVVSRLRPTSATELKPSKVLKRSDCKDIHKKSTVKKSRYMTVFPGQLGDLKEGKLGSLAKLDTQNPVMYIEYPGFGRLKLQGTIVRSRSTRYFTLNVKSKDRLNLEDWCGRFPLPHSTSAIGPVTKTVYSYYGVQYFQSLILVTLTGVLWYLTQYRVNLPPGHTPVPCPIPEHTSRPTDTFFSVSQYRGLLIDELTDRGLTNCWFISGLLYKIKLAERETSGPMDISNDLEAYQERMDLLCEMIEDGDVDGDGKYFPFNTFRRLIAQTRLTFLFTISGVGADDDEDAYEIDDGVTVSRRQKKRVAACAAKAGVQVFEGRASGVPGGPFVDRFQKVLYPAPLDKTGGAWHGRVVLKKPKLVEKVRPRVSQIKRRRLFDGCPPVATVQHIRHNLDCSARLC